MNCIYICGLAQDPGPYDRFLWMQVYGAFDSRRRAEDWILMEVEDSGVPGHRPDSSDEEDDEDDVDPDERQHFEDLDQRTFYFIQEKGINNAHVATWRLMPDRTWKKLRD